MPSSDPAAARGKEITKDTDRQSDNLQRPLEKALGRNRGAFLKVGKYISMSLRDRTGNIPAISEIQI